jgi:DNA-binding SARP family transcriptional activator/tetratricopeptide (TPR) repeat protein
MPESRPQTLWFDGFVIDLARGCLRRDGADLRLRPKSFEVLRFMAENHGRLLSKEEIISSVWKDAFVTDNSLVQCLIEVRRALGEGSQTIIRTVPRRGYIFDVPVTAGDKYDPTTRPAREQRLAAQPSQPAHHPNPTSTAPSVANSPASSAAATHAATRVELLGGFRMSTKGVPLTSVVSRTQALLAYLLLHAGSTVSRQQLAFLFWPDSSEPQARTNLRQLLHHLRSAWHAAEDHIDSDAAVVRWRTEEPFTFDVSEFEGALSEADEAHRHADCSAVQRALLSCVDLYRGNLLPALHDEWIETHRERLQQKYSDVLTRLIALFEQAHDYQAAIRHAESLLAQDYFRETVYQTIMRLHGLNGDRAGALRAYERCATVLRRELGVEPGISTRRIRDQISKAEMQPQSASEPPARSSESALVGRQAEWKRLLDTWRAAAQAHASFVIVTGEAGIGKTRLIEELLSFTSRQGASVARTACYGVEKPMAYAPVADWLRSPRFRAELDGFSPPQHSQLARVLPELLVEGHEVELPQAFTDTWQRHHFFEALARAVLSAPPPILLFIDDLQWCDAETIEWLHYLLRSNPEADLLIAAAVRLEEVDRDHPATAVLNALTRDNRVSEIVLKPLSAEETTSLAIQVVQREVDRETSGILYEQTRGNPLFIVEAVRGGLLSQSNSMSGGEANFLPPKVQAVITARLAQLSGAARDLAGLAAAIGRPFTFELLAKVSQAGDTVVAAAVDELWRRHIIQSQARDSYDFSHGQIRSVAYAELGPAHRHLLHLRIAEELERLYAADPGSESALIAWHYEQAGAVKQAISHYRDAAKVVLRRYADREAINYLSKAMRLLQGTLSSRERDRTELALLVSLGSSLITTQGYASAEVGRVYAQARLLCEITGDSDASYFKVLSGSYLFHAVRAELASAQEIAARYVSLARKAQDVQLSAAGQFLLGGILVNCAPLQARQHLQDALSYCDNTPNYRPFFDFGPELRVFARAHLSLALWLLGFPDQAMEENRRNIAIAEEISHPFSQALALAYSAIQHQYRGEPETAAELAGAAAAVCHKHGFRYYLSWTPIIRGWAHARQGALAEGLVEMRDGFAALRATGALLRGPYYLSLMAETCRQMGRLEEGWNYITEAFALGQRSKETWFKPELDCIKGDILLDRGDKAEAEACYREAFRVACDLGTPFFELRAVVRLARLGLGSTQRAKAVAQLADTYRKFDEGFDTPDLVEARTLLKCSGGAVGVPQLAPRAQGTRNQSNRSPHNS